MPAPPPATDVHTWADEWGAVGAAPGTRHCARSEPRRRAVRVPPRAAVRRERKNGCSQPRRRARDPYVGDSTVLRGGRLGRRPGFSAPALAGCQGHLADPRGVMIVDEDRVHQEGDTKSAGVSAAILRDSRRVENCKVGVLLAFAGRSGHHPATASGTCPGVDGGTPGEVQAEGALGGGLSPPRRRWPSGC